MRGENVDMIRKRFYETFVFFRGKGFTGAEVTMGLWEASSLDLIYNMLKKGYKLISPSGEEMGWEDIGPIQSQMETMVVDEGNKPECFGTNKVQVRKGVPRYDCVLCTWELPCADKYSKSKGKRKRKRKRKRMGKKRSQ